MCVELFHAPRTPELVEFGLHEEAGGFLLDSVSAVVINMSPTHSALQIYDARKAWFLAFLADLLESHGAFDLLASTKNTILLVSLHDSLGRSSVLHSPTTARALGSIGIPLLEITGILPDETVVTDHTILVPDTDFLSQRGYARKLKGRAGAPAYSAIFTCLHVCAQAISYPSRDSLISLIAIVHGRESMIERYGEGWQQVYTKWTKATGMRCLEQSFACKPKKSGGLMPA
jgi:hypothetical protein